MGSTFFGYIVAFFLVSHPGEFIYDPQPLWFILWSRNAFLKHNQK